MGPEPRTHEGGTKEPGARARSGLEPPTGVMRSREYDIRSRELFEGRAYYRAGYVVFRWVRITVTRETIIPGIGVSRRSAGTIPSMGCIPNLLIKIVVL